MLFNQNPSTHTHACTSNSLYGHKLPVMCMDMSDDNELIATGSADKTVKLWGLDFGDCHRCVTTNESMLEFVFGKWWDARNPSHTERDTNAPTLTSFHNVT